MKGRQDRDQRSSFSDAEIAAVANYITSRFGSKGSQLYRPGRGGVEEANFRMIAGGRR
jgi:hypothetical protein